MNLLDKFKNIFSFHKEAPKLQTTEEVIEELINRLILKLKAEGKSIASPEISDKFGSFNIYVLNLGKENAMIQIEKFDDRNNKWCVKVKPYFDKF